MTDQGPGGQQARFELNQRLSALRLQIEQERYKGAIGAAGLTFEADKKAAKTPAALEEAQKVFDAAISRSTKLYNEALADIESSSRKTLSELAARGEEAVQQVRLTEVTRLLDNLTATTERTQAADNAALTLLEQKLDYERQIFDFKNSTGQLTTEEYRLGTLRLQQLTNELTLQKSLLNAVNARDNATLQLLRDMAAAPGADTEFGPVPQAGQPTFIARGIAMGQAFTDTATAASTLYNQQSSILALNVSLTDSAVKLGETWSQQFSKMTDALMEFVKTGKFSFKDFMTSMLGDFTRTLLQMQMQNFAKALFGGTGAVGSSLAAFFGIPSAMGNAFSTAGVMKYAMGGTFTNQIVNKPTLFKAANGLGVMGEAGPEAIMPLRRGSNGVLGVESSGGAVSVVVNNYGKERAEVKETTDGRGNRKVEVIVGEMVAGEMSRIGSPLQQTMGNTYGLTMPPGRR